MADISLQTGWGTRAGIGDPSAATAAAANQGSNEKVPIISTPTPVPQYAPTPEYSYNAGGEIPQRVSNQYNQPAPTTYGGGGQGYGRPPQSPTAQGYGYTRQGGANYGAYAQ